MICDSCKQVLPEQSLFCSNCGRSTAKINLVTTIKSSSDTDPNRHSPPQNRKPDPHIGVVLDEKYQLLELLGQGGMGSVYRARRLHIGDDVAVKLLCSDLLRDAEAIERFRREARSAAMIRHPNVVAIYDFNDASANETTAEAYIVMELVSGATLRRLLEREGRLLPARAAAFMRDICAGVGVAHRQGLLHRDLKPDNVIVSPPSHEGEQETAKVVDFGLAKVRDDNVSPLTKTGILMGTIYYMAPEQCRGEDLDARADVYSLGAMLYEMLSGRPPFSSSNIAGLITKHLNDPPPPFDPSLQIPSALAQSCLRALAKRREDRQLDALAFGREVQSSLANAGQVNFASNSDLTIGDKSTRTSAGKWLAGLVGIFAIGFVLVALGLVIKFGSDWFGQKETTNKNTESRAQTTNTQTERQTEPASTEVNISNLNGNWKGTYGPMGQSASLVIKNHKGNVFEGVLEQAGTRVAFKGTIQKSTVHIKQTAVLSGAGWSLGEDTGTISGDGRRISGTGKDTLGGSLGITYEWTFSR